MSDPTLTIRVQYKEDGSPAIRRTIDVAIRPNITIDELVDRGMRRTANAIMDLFEDLGHSPGNITGEGDISVPVPGVDADG